MASLGNFDATSVEPTTGFDPIPAGNYLAVITGSEMKNTKTGTGQYLEVTVQVIDGPYANRKLWDRLTLVHQNSQTVEIAQRKLSAICRSVGIMQPQDSSQLHGIPMTIRVTYKNDQKYGPSNEIGGYKEANQGALHPPSAIAPPPVAATPKPSSPTFPPIRGGVVPAGNRPPNDFMPLSMPPWGTRGT